MANWSMQAQLSAASGERDALAQKLKNVQSVVKEITARHDALLDRCVTVKAKSRLWKLRFRRLSMRNELGRTEFYKPITAWRVARCTVSDTLHASPRSSERALQNPVSQSLRRNRQSHRHQWGKEQNEGLTTAVELSNDGGT